MFIVENSMCVFFKLIQGTGERRTSDFRPPFQLTITTGKWETHAGWSKISIEQWSWNNSSILAHKHTHTHITSLTHSQHTHAHTHTHTHHTHTQDWPALTHTHTLTQTHTLWTVLLCLQLCTHSNVSLLRFLTLFRPIDVYNYTNKN